MKKMILLALCFILPGCAAMVAEYQANTCNYNGGYEKGVNDATAGAPSNAARIADPCDPKIKAETMAGYREGYMAIKKTPVININSGYAPAPKRCEARAGSEAHASFCANLNSFSCSAHTSLCVYR